MTSQYRGVLWVTRIQNPLRYKQATINFLKIFGVSPLHSFSVPYSVVGADASMSRPRTGLQMRWQLTGFTHTGNREISLVFALILLHLKLLILPTLFQHCLYYIKIRI